RVNTPTAVIAVRGTIFDVLVKEDKTEIFLHEGEVAVNNLESPERAVSLSAGQMTSGQLGRTPNAPRRGKTGRATRDIRSKVNDGKTRIAIGGSRHDFGRGGPLPNGRARPDFGRGGPPTNAPRSNGGGAPKP